MQIECVFRLSRMWYRHSNTQWDRGRGRKGGERDRERENEGERERKYNYSNRISIIYYGSCSVLVPAYKSIQICVVEAYSSAVLKSSCDWSLTRTRA